MFYWFPEDFTHLKIFGLQHVDGFVNFDSLVVVLSVDFLPSLITEKYHLLCIQENVKLCSSVSSDCILTLLLGAFRLR